MIESFSVMRKKRPVKKNEPLTLRIFIASRAIGAPSNAESAENTK